MEGFIHVVARQAASTIIDGAVPTGTDASSAPTDAPTGCPITNNYNGNFGARVSSIFVILVCASLGEI